MRAVRLQKYLSAKKLITALLIGLCIGNSLYLSKKIAMRAVEERSNSFGTQITLINNKVSNVIQLDETGQLAADNSLFTASSLNEVAKNIEEVGGTSKSSIWERLFVAQQVKKLEAKIELATVPLIETKESITTLSTRLTLLSKFLGYSAREDFVNLGKDNADDTERIERALSAIDALSKDVSMQDTELLPLIISSREAVVAFQSTKDVVSLDTAIHTNQKAIIRLFNEDLVRIQKQISMIYETHLYQ